jgi:hypothetical protein
MTSGMLIVRTVKMLFVIMALPGFQRITVSHQATEVPEVFILTSSLNDNNLNIQALGKPQNHIYHFIVVSLKTGLQTSKASSPQSAI